MGNGIFRSEIGSGFEDPGGTPPPRIPINTPPGPLLSVSSGCMNRMSERGISSESDTQRDGLPALLTRISSHKHGQRGKEFINVGWGEEGLGKGMEGDHPV